jgi:hypothetical protein
MANEVTIHVKAKDNTDMDRIGRTVESKAKKSFLRSGGHAGAAFAAGFIKTITLGQIGSGFAMAATRLKPQMAHVGGGLGVAIAAAVAVKLAKSLSALLPLALGGAILALPIAGIIKKQLAVLKDIEKIDSKILTQKEKIAHSTGETRKEAEKELGILQKQKKELEEQAKHLIRLQDKAKQFMAEISKPVEVPLFKSMRLVGDALDSWGPRFAKAIKPLAKELPGFVKGALEGIENFAEALGKKMPSITEGFKAWGKELPAIGTALGEMLAAWIEEGPALQEGIADTAGSMKDLANAVGSVGKGFRKFNQINKDFVNFREEVRLTALELRVKMLSALHTVASALGKFSPRFKTIADEIGEMLGEARKEAKKTSDEINRRKTKATVKADIKDLEGKVKDAKKRLRETNDQKTKAKIRAEIAQLQQAVRTAKSLLNTLNGKTYTTYLRTAVYRVNVNSPKSFATGGNVGAERPPARAATGGPRGSQVWVGEHGPELVDLPHGSHVNSNPDSKKMGMGNQPMTIILDLGKGIQERFEIHDREVRRAVSAGRSGY